MLRVYDHYKYVYSYSAGIEFSRQILTIKVHHRAAKVKVDFFNTNISQKMFLLSSVWR